jgi:hypothetical protein
MVAKGGWVGGKSIKYMQSDETACFSMYHEIYTAHYPYPPLTITYASCDFADVLNVLIRRVDGKPVTSDYKRQLETIDV